MSFRIPSLFASALYTRIRQLTVIRLNDFLTAVKSTIFRPLAPLGGFEPPTFRLGEPLNICHLCSPMYRKVAIRQAFFVFRVAPCSSKFTGVVRCSPVHFSSFLDFSKKGNKNIFYLPPILAHFRVKIHLQSNRKPEQNISHLPEKYSLGKMIKKRVLHSRFE